MGATVTQAYTRSFENWPPNVCTIGLNLKKNFHLRMAVLMRGEGQKRNDHWPFCMVKVGIDIILERQCLNQSKFLFHRTEGSNYEMFEITWQVSTSKAVLH